MKVVVWFLVMLTITLVGYRAGYASGHVDGVLDGKLAIIAIDARYAEWKR